MAAMRFVPPTLADLSPPPAVEDLDFEALRTARLAELSARLTTAGLADVAAVLQLEGEPLTINAEASAAAELAWRQRLNEAVRACLIASAAGADLDHLATTFYGVQRLVLAQADPGAAPPVAEVLESDADYRARALLSMEAHSSAGPEGAYLFFAVSADADVLDAAVYGEEDGASYGDDPADLVLAPEVLVLVLSRLGDGAASGALLAAVAAALNAEEVRPIGDKVTVEAASILHFSVEGVLRYAAGADPAPLVAEAHARVAAHCAARHRIGRRVQRLGVGAAMKVGDVEELELVLKDAGGAPIVGDVDPGSKGAAFCTSIVITAEVAEDDWR